MLPFPFVERLDVLEAGGLHVAMGGVANSMHPLVLEAVVPTFSRCVVGTSPEISSAKGDLKLTSLLEGRKLRYRNLPLNL